MLEPQRSAVARGSLNRVLLAGGLLEVAALFTPAVRVRIVGTVPFIRLPTAGATLLVLGVATIIVAFRSARWWRWLPGVLSALVLGVAYWRIVTAPSGSFIDPLLRHAVHPAWGFIVMGVAAAVTLVGAGLGRPAVPPSAPPQPVS